MRAYFDRLKPRERWAVMFGGGFLLVVSFYLFIWSPFTSSISDKKTQVEARQSLLQWMQSSGNNIQRFHAEGFQFNPSLENMPLLAKINSAFQTQNLMRFFLVSPRLKGQVVVMQLGDVPFDALMSTLDQLWKTSNVVVVNIKVVERPAPGTVNALVTLAQK